MVTAAKLNDDTVGRCLDRIYDTGAGQILTAVALRAVKLFDIDTSHVHHDTTSVTLYGDYDLYGDDDPKQPFVITYGFGKDHRPDLKQLVHSVLCVDHRIPIHSKIENGNRSDKTIKRDLLDLIVEKMREVRQDNPLYVADSALVTEDNLSLMSDNKKGCGFVTRLPMTYKQCGQAISRAVDMDQWEELGVLSQEVSSPKRQPAHYHGFETTGALTKAEKEAGCFVLITNEMDLKRIGSRKLLEIYKSQDTIEKNFGFLKDEQIVNALFLKTLSRIEALGLIFILSLLVWGLMV